MKWIKFFIVIFILDLQTISAEKIDISFSDLLKEMIDRSTVTKRPKYPYKTLQASSYNRAAKTPDDPKGWFANNDQGFCIRKENKNGRTESVLMECNGPGVITRIWAPFFYQDYNNRKGPDICIYLDDSCEPTIQMNLIELLTKNSLVDEPFSSYTCRAGDLYLPIPFNRGSKITVIGDPFFYIINYRAYDKDINIETFNPNMLKKHKKILDKIGQELLHPTNYTKGTKINFKENISPNNSKSINLPKGNSAIRHLKFKLNTNNISQSLRSLVLEMKFDGQRTVWCPIGDFFGNVNEIDPYKMWEREVQKDGSMICRWIMPYQNNAEIILHNLSTESIDVTAELNVSSWQWTETTYYFHANWWTDIPYMADPVRDMNFIEIEGEGILVGDNFAVLNPLPWWWGEGDEKIFVDEDFEKNFPSHFGTGTEDYYGWAGGVHPSREDEFSKPFIANIRVGGISKGFSGENPHTRGYNICSRSRSLDAIPFNKKFKFDIEAFNFSTGSKAILQYALTSIWYGATNVKHNRTPLIEWASKSVPQIDDLEAITNYNGYYIQDAIEFESLKINSNDILTEVINWDDKQSNIKCSMGKFICLKTNKQGYLSFNLLEQYHPKSMTIHFIKKPSKGAINIYINNNLIVENLNLSTDKYENFKIHLGEIKPMNNKFEIKISATTTDSAPFELGLDCIELTN